MTRSLRLVVLCALLAACDGTRGTLVTLNEGIAGDAGSAGAGAEAGSGGNAPTFDWQIQLSGELDTSFDVPWYEADLFALDAAAVAAVKTPGRTLACYVSVGTAEPWRADFDELPDAAIGNALSDYPQERWLDVRSEAVRAVMGRRLDTAAALGCTSVELANLAAHRADSGFPLTQADELDYAEWLIREAHARALGAGVSASDDLVPLLVSDADWGLTEECLAYDSCAVWGAFVEHGKPVLMIEYGSASNAPALCPEAAQRGFSLVIKRRALDAFRVGCDR